MERLLLIAELLIGCVIAGGGLGWLYRRSLPDQEALYQQHHPSIFAMQELTGNSKKKERAGL